MATYKPVTTPRAWLYQIAHNLAIDLLRKETVRSPHPLEYFEHIPDEKDAIEECLDEQISLQYMQVIMPLLKPVDRTIFAMKLEGFDHVEISADLGISADVIKSRVFRARRMLKRLKLIEVVA
jgi:RNA polymerase sigma-70 factor (ECF subfamily)